MVTVLWISVVGAALLFAALAGLVGLMYLLTAPWLFTERPAAAAPLVPALDGAAEEEAEHERRRRAAALAVATACAEQSLTAFVPPETLADWRMLHRARRMAVAAGRQRTRR
jgi:hypothetical protein